MNWKSFARIQRDLFQSCNLKLCGRLQTSSMYSTVWERLLSVVLHVDSGECDRITFGIQNIRLESWPCSSKNQCILNYSNPNAPSSRQRWSDILFICHVAWSLKVTSNASLLTRIDTFCTNTLCSWNPHKIAGMEFWIKKTYLLVSRG